MNDLKISVVIPIYNVKDYLKECVDSVLFQTVKPYEIILVDDGSTDGSEKICDEFSKEKLVRVIHKQNAGVSSARNIGIKEAKGDYICFIDGDDYLERKTFEDYYNIFEKYGYEDAIIDRMKFFYDGTNVFYKENDFYIDSDMAKGKTGKEVFAICRNEFKRYDVGIRGIFNLSLIKSKNIFFNEKYKYSEDVDWMINFILNADDGILGNKVANYCYRSKRKGSLQNTYSIERIKCFLDVYNSWDKLIKDSNDNNSYFIKALKKELGNRYIRLLDKTLYKVEDKDYILAKKIIHDNSNLLIYNYPENTKSFLIKLLSIFGYSNAITIYTNLKNLIK